MKSVTRQKFLLPYNALHQPTPSPAIAENINSLSANNTVRQMMNAPGNDSEDDYFTQGEFEPSNAKPILQRLEREGIRFEIQSNIHNVRSYGKGLAFRDVTMIEIFVHAGDLERWERIWAEMFPLDS